MILSVKSIDIATAYFYFSGFRRLAKELKDVVRILVGKAIDPRRIDEIAACSSRIQMCP